MKLLDRTVVAILMNELGLHEEVKEKFHERFWYQKVILDTPPKRQLKL